MALRGIYKKTGIVDNPVVLTCYVSDPPPHCTMVPALLCECSARPGVRTPTAGTRGQPRPRHLLTTPGCLASLSGGVVRLFGHWSYCYQSIDWVHKWKEYGNSDFGLPVLFPSSFHKGIIEGGLLTTTVKVCSVGSWFRDMSQINKGQGRIVFLNLRQINNITKNKQYLGKG